MANVQKGESARPLTIERLRSEIDRGAAQDKVSFPDPAVAPLGADAEATGNPPTVQELGLEMRQLKAAAPQEEDRPIDGEGPVVSWGGLIAKALAFLIAGGFLVCLRFG